MAIATATEKEVTASLLKTCHHSIQSLAQSLTTLHSIDALQCLREDAKTLEAFITITSFSSILVPAAAQLSGVRLAKSVPQEIRDDSVLNSQQQSDHTTDSSGETLQLRVELEDELGDADKPIELQDGRDAIGQVIGHQDRLSASDNGSLSSKFLHPVLAGTNPPPRPLYSFLVYFADPNGCPKGPAYLEKVMSIIHPDVGTAGARPPLHFSTQPYPRVRQLKGSRAGQRILLIMDDDTDRLNGIYNRFIAIQESEWVNPASMWLGHGLPIIGLWGERHAVLVFKTMFQYELDYMSALDSSYLAGFRTLSHSPHLLWKALLEQFPVLGLYRHPMMKPNQQEDSNSGDFIGGRYLAYQGGQQFYEEEFGYLFVPLYNSGDFAEDFISTKPTLTIPVSGGTHHIKFEVDAVVMEPPVNIGPSGLKWDV